MIEKSTIVKFPQLKNSVQSSSEVFVGIWYAVHGVLNAKCDQYSVNWGL